MEDAQVARLDERDRSLEQQLVELRRVVDRIEARLWWLVTGGGIAAVGGATAAVATVAQAAMQ